MSGHDHDNRSLLQDIEHWAQQNGSQPWLVEDWSSNKRQISWSEGASEVRSAAAWLAANIEQAGTRIGLLSPNCAHWILADYAIMASANVTVPIFTTMDPASIDYVSRFSGLEMLVLGAIDNWPALSESLPAGIPVVLLPGAPPVEGGIPWSTLIAAGAELPAAPAVDDAALSTIVFTSGTTGKPKGVMHSMRTLREAADGVGQVSGTQPGNRFISYLPLPHLGERVVVENHATIYGGTIYFNENQASFLADLRNARPNWMLGVPRIWEKLQQVVLAHVASLDDLEAARAAGELDALADKVQAFLGLQDSNYILTSTAPTPAPLKAWYDDLGIILYDGYGQSEMLPISANSPADRKLGSIGPATRGVEIRIAEDGEILARGGGTAMGYYLAPEKTAETFDEQGWIHTGDRGFIDDDGHLHLTGRVKEIFKTAKGKYVAPAPIEGIFLETALVEQACLTGLGLAQTVMLAVLTESAAGQADEELRSALLAHTAAVNAGLEKHAQIGALLISRTPWSQENDILTHTLKIKRDRIETSFEDAIAAAGDHMRDSGDLLVTFIR